MATKKQPRRPFKTYEGVTLHATNSEITKTAQLGRISETADKEFTFEGEDNVFSRDTERRWYTKSVNKPYNRRLTKNVKTGEYKVTYNIDQSMLERLNNRLAHDMANDLSETLEKIIFYNDKK